MAGRGHWGSSLGFVLAAAGSAIGLGNLWKFPYITWHNNGGAFVLVYLICIAAVGLPIMMAEILIGRKTQLSPMGAMKAAAGEKWKLVGGLGVLAGFVILSYYAVVAGWSVFYFIKCVGWSFGEYPVGAASDALGPLLGSAGLQIGLAALFLAITATVIYAGVCEGIERVARSLMPILFVILLLLLVTALRMPGAGEALGFIFRPNFDEMRPAGVLEALGHSFFTLSLGMGAMITYGSYMRRGDSVVKSSLAVVVLDTLIAILATVIMFSVIFSVAGVRDSISASTVGMLFVTLPELFYTQIPLGGVLGPLFYVLVGFAALTSAISLLEVVVAYCIDSLGWSRAKATLSCTSIIFVVSVLCGLSLGAVTGLSELPGFPGKAGVFNNLDHLASNWMLPVGGFFITLAAGWAMTRESTESELVDDHKPAWFSYGVWRFFIRYISPIAVGAIIVAVILGRDFT